LKRPADGAQLRIPAESGLIKAASRLGSLTMVSRVLGYIRDSLNASLFGAGWVADAYFVAFRIPNLLRDLVGEGAMSAAVVPTLARLCRAGTNTPRERAEAGRLISALLTWALLGGLALVLAGVFAAPFIVRLMAPGWIASPRTFALTVSLTRWLFPFIVCMSLAAVVQGWLTSQERFGPQAFAPVALNACVILGGVLLCPRFGPAPEAQIYGWVAGVLAGGLAQWLVQVPAARELGFRFQWRLWHPGLGSVGALMAPALIGFSITQIYLLVNTVLASLLPEGSVAHIYYGNRLMQLPLGVVGVAISTATYPVVARAFVDRRPRAAAAALNHAIKLAGFAVLPASAGLIALGGPINALLFRSGRFTESDAVITAAVSSAYAIGILGHVANRILAPSFYAAGRPYLPVQVDGVGLVSNALLSCVLMTRYGVIGLPLSTSLVTLATSVWLGVRLRTITPGLGDRAVGVSLLRHLAAAALMGAVIWWSADRLGGVLADRGIALKLREALVTGGGVLVGAAVFGAAAWMLGSEEMREVARAIRRRVSFAR